MPPELIFLSQCDKCSRTGRKTFALVLYKETASVLRVSMIVDSPPALRRLHQQRGQRVGWGLYMTQHPTSLKAAGTERKKTTDPKQ